LKEGQRLTFSLRANPVVTKINGNNNKRSRHDVIMNAKHDLAISGSGRQDISTGEIEYKAGIKWLEDRSNHLGFTFDHDLVRVFGYRQFRIKRRSRKVPIQFSSLDYNGVLSVTDPGRFNNTLINGIGRSKAFGCGLMLVKRFN
jgi:CRISPR system Cascade subunit CasE